MSEGRSFEELCGSFGNTAFLGNELECFGAPGASGDDFFVEPLLLSLEQQPKASVTLISARGAAGKSKAAVEIARRLQAPLWRLEKDRAVSGTSLEYVLAQYLGSHAVEDELRRRPSPLIVIDSLDEARSRVSGVSWMEFTQSLIRLSGSNLRYVLFGRERTLEDLWVALDQGGLSISWWEISHFAPSQCTEYVDGVVRKRDSAADTTTAEYSSARDAILKSLRGAAEGSDTDAFVGYPPVLDAVAALLIRRPNLLAIRSRFEDPQAVSEGRIRLLGEILERLLRRDQEKALPLAIDLNLDPDEVYSPVEQVGWLCHALEGADPPDFGYIADSTVRVDYAQRISQFADDHPFRSAGKWASPVFEAYVASREFDNSTFADERLIEIGHKSGLLYDFVSLKGDLAIDERQFAALHASIAAAEWVESTASISIDQLNHNTIEAAFALRRGTEKPRQASFEILSEQPASLTLFGPLSDLSVRVDGAVVVPPRGHGTVLGPDLFIHADAVIFEGSALEFARRSDADASRANAEPSVIIEVQSQLRLPDTSTQVPLEGELELRVPNQVKLKYPWFEYRIGVDWQSETPDEKIVRFINKLMNLTRSHGHHGERGVFVKKFEGRQPLQAHEFRKALDVLVSRGVVRLEDEMVFVRSEWEKYRYSGKALKGQRQLADVIGSWQPIIQAIEESLGWR